ncbi:MAG: hypothetical protein AB1635_12625 [Acidobacteriota bacterium]
MRIATGMACVIVALAATAAACGKSDAEKQAEEAAARAEQAAAALQKAAESGEAAKGVAEFAKAMEGMASAMSGGDGTTVEPVSFRDLQAALPDVPGWSKGTPEGERMTSPVAFSQAEVRYTRDDRDVEVRIVDSGFHQILMAPWSMFLAAGYERETSEGTERAVTIAGNPGFEKWDRTDQRGELNLVVGKRYLVTVEGSVDDPKVLRDFLSRMDLEKLAALK